MSFGEIDFDHNFFAPYSYTLKSTGITLIARGEWMNLGTHFDLAIKQSGYSILMRVKVLRSVMLN